MNNPPPPPPPSMHRRRRPRQRLVVLAGPHKSASSSVQAFFLQHASSSSPPSSSNQNRLPAFQNWTWPYQPRRRKYQPRKGYAPLVCEDEGFQQLILQSIRETWNANTSTTTNNLVLGTEELDRFGTTPWSHLDGIRAIWQLRNATTTTPAPTRTTIENENEKNDDDDDFSSPNMQIVVNYRRPRSDQWISIWKQLTRKNQKSYRDYMCPSEQYLRNWEYLDCVANPLGFVDALLQQQQKAAAAAGGGGRLWTVDLMDMQGISEAGKDISHTIACHVLGDIPCVDGWVQGVGGGARLVHNQRSGDSKLSPQQWNDLEWILRQRDCTYQQKLLRYQELGVLKIHFGNTIWDGCDPNINHNHSNNSSNNKGLFLDTTFLLELLQQQLGCGKNSTDLSIAEYREQHKMQKRQNPNTNVLPTDNKSKEEKQRPPPLQHRKPFTQNKNTKNNKNNNVIINYNNKTTSNKTLSKAVLDVSLPESNWPDPDIIMNQSIRIQLMGLCSLLFAMVFFLARHLKWKGYCMGMLSHSYRNNKKGYVEKRVKLGN